MKITTIALLAVAAGCSDDGGTGPGASGPFAPVLSIITENSCRNCHNGNNSVFHGGFELVNDRAADSVAVSNYLDFVTPNSSPVIQRLLIGSSLDHPIRRFTSLTDPNVVAIASYAQALAAAGASRVLTAAKVTAAPAIDGIAEAAWGSVTGIEIPIGGGFAGSISVTMKAMYVPGDRVFFLVTWADATESVVRAPWLRTATGWLHESVAPSGFNSAELANWRAQPSRYLYEDKLAIIWNTTGASEVAGFNTNGCAVLCHVNPPWVTRPLKYTNSVGEVADMWHWKLVRTNVVHRLDDQYVYWNRDLVVSANAGRAGDPGGGEYAGNGSVTLGNGAVVPKFTSANQPASPYYMVDSATAAAWAAAAPGWTIPAEDVARLTTVADAYATGDHLAYAITTLKPNVDRSHVEAYGTWAGGRWTLEIARSLTTNSTGAIPAGGTTTVPVDVQFTPGQTYHFGLAVFENAQIEHSWSPSVFQFRFQP